MLKKDQNRWKEDGRANRRQHTPAMVVIVRPMRTQEEGCRSLRCRAFFSALLLLLIASPRLAVGGGNFLFAPKLNCKPQLILISGVPGTGKSTFGMSVALSQSILKCVSTDVIREVTRNAVADKPPELMRSSYEGDGDPVADWKLTCAAVESGVQGLVDDALRRGTSLVLEGVHIVPNNDLINKWQAGGGQALGCLLMISEVKSHKSLLLKRGRITKKGEDKKLMAFERIRLIQNDLIAMAKANNWMLIEQRIEPDPLDTIASFFDNDPTKYPDCAP